MIIVLSRSKCEWGKKNAVATNTSENAVYNWMAPEVMFNMPPSFYCDMYGFCAVLWEIFHGKLRVKVSKRMLASFHFFFVYSI